MLISVPTFDAFLGKHSFNVPQRGCGTVSQQGGRKSTAASNAFQRSIDVGGGATPSGLEQQQQIFLENTIIIQNDPDFQEAGDTARRLRCVWVSITRYYDSTIPRFHPSKRLVTHVIGLISINSLISFFVKPRRFWVTNFKSFILYRGPTPCRNLSTLRWLKYINLLW